MGHARRNLGHAERAAHVEALLADAAPLHDVLDAASMAAAAKRSEA